MAMPFVTRIVSAPADIMKTPPKWRKCAGTVTSESSCLLSH